MSKAKQDRRMLKLGRADKQTIDIQERHIVQRP